MSCSTLSFPSPFNDRHRLLRDVHTYFSVMDISRWFPGYLCGRQALTQRSWDDADSLHGNETQRRSERFPENNNDRVIRYDIAHELLQRRSFCSL